MKTDGRTFQVKTKRPVKKDVMPRLPHERDESDDSQASGPRDDMRQAYLDITNGQVDTDLRAGRGVEETVRPKDNRRSNRTPNPLDKTTGKKGGS